MLPNAMPRNPFGTTGGWYVNPTLRDNLESTIATGVATPAEVAVLNQMKEIPSAFWIDHYGKISGTGRLDTLEGILEDAAAKADPPLCVFIFYDLPNRDCNAKASNGEISFRGDDAADVALAEYRTQYVDPFVAILARYSSVPVVIVVEPDSLGNVISNAGRNGCSEATVNNYKAGIKYAVDALSIARSSSSAATLALYVDAAHGGWMGYEPNAQAFVSLMVEIGILDKIRGFSTNVANYQTLGLEELCPAAAFAQAGQVVHGATQGVAEWCKTNTHSCCDTDPCDVMNLGSGGATELSFVQTLQEHFALQTGWQPHFIIDTGRNGAPSSRHSCESWCNIKGAGAGHVPSMNTGLPSVVDAFFWLKTPGESDGCTRLLPSGESCPRFDRDCEGRDSITTPHAPEAGMWFHYQVAMLARNADLRLDALGALDSLYGVTFPPPPPPPSLSPPPPWPPPSPRPQPPQPSPPSPSDPQTALETASFDEWSAEGYGYEALPPSPAPTSGNGRGGAMAAAPRGHAHAGGTGSGGNGRLLLGLGLCAAGVYAYAKHRGHGQPLDVRAAWGVLVARVGVSRDAKSAASTAWTIEDPAPHRSPHTPSSAPQEHHSKPRDSPRGRGEQPRVTAHAMTPALERPVISLENPGKTSKARAGKGADGAKKAKQMKKSSTGKASVGNAADEETRSLTGGMDRVDSAADLGEDSDGNVYL